MFQKACKAMAATIAPIILLYKDDKDNVGYSIGAGMILNEDGWVLTAAHIIKTIQDCHSGHLKIPKRKKPITITHFSTQIGTINSPFECGFSREQTDIAAAKILNFVPESDRVYPRLRSTGVEAGELLCRIGFPFVEDIQPIQIGWSNEQGFIAPNLLPVPAFVNEALASRIVGLGSTGDEWIETSSPGLRGQSGGPLADVDGFVCGIQVNTGHYPLGFQNAGRNQVLNVGRAVEVKTIRRFLEANGIKYYTDTD